MLDFIGLLPTVTLTRTSTLKLLRNCPQGSIVKRLKPAPKNKRLTTSAFECLLLLKFDCHRSPRAWICTTVPPLQT